jgi:hypothetical protein
MNSHTLFWIKNKNLKKKSKKLFMNKIMMNLT